jgi:hypothetical protein
MNIQGQWLPFYQALRFRRGALMAAALMMLVVLGVLMSSWVTLLGARANQVVLLDDVIKRRQALMNSKMLGKQLMFQNGYEGDKVFPRRCDMDWDPDGSSWGSV